MAPKVTLLEVEKRPFASITREELKRDYLLPRKPLVLTDYPLEEKVSFEDLADRVGGDRQISVSGYHPDHRQLRRDRATQYLQRGRGNVPSGAAASPPEPVHRTEMGIREYMRRCATDDFPDWPAGYSRPYYSFAFRQFDPVVTRKRDLILGKDIRRIDALFSDWSQALPLPRIGRWLFPSTVTYAHAGPRGTHTPWHYDTGCVHSWSLNLFGKKRALLVSPEEARKQVAPPTRDLRFADLESGAGLTTDLVAHQAVNTERSILFIPAGWWHEVSSIEPTITVVCGFVNETNIAAYLRELGTLAYRKVTRTA